MAGIGAMLESRCPSSRVWNASSRTLVSIFEGASFETCIFGIPSLKLSFATGHPRVSGLQIGHRPGFAQWPERQHPVLDDCTPFAPGLLAPGTARFRPVSDR